MAYTDYKWAIEKFGDDLYETTLMNGKRVDLMVKSRGNPGESRTNTMGADRERIFFRIDGGPWGISMMRSKLDTAKQLETSTLGPQFLTNYWSYPCGTG